MYWLMSSKIRIEIAKSDEELDIVQDMTTYAFSPSPIIAERDTWMREYTKDSIKYIQRKIYSQLEKNIYQKS